VVRSTPSLAKALPVVARPAAELVRPWSIVERLVARQALVTPEGASQQTPRAAATLSPAPAAAQPSARQSVRSEARALAPPAPWLPDVTVHSMWRAVKVLSNPAAGSPVD
jgi:hypothetical protein